MKRSEVNAKIGSADKITFHRDGTITAKWGYYYRHGRTPEYYEARIKSVFPGATVIGSGDHWHEFVGGAKAGSSQDSYMWVKFKIP